MSPENLAKVKPTMTQQEVKSLLGDPPRKENSTFLGLHGTAWIYQLGASKVTVSFVNDSVISIQK